MTPLVAFLVGMAAVLQLYVIFTLANDYLNTENSAVPATISLIVFFAGVVIFILSTGV